MASVATTSRRIEASEVKEVGRGKAIDILVDVAGIPRDLLDNKPHACPKCGGVDRFRLVDAEAGAVRCNQCFTEHCGDFIAAVQWARGQTFVDSLHSVASYLGVSVNGNGRQAGPFDLMGEFARRKHISSESLKAYGAALADRGGKQVVRLPMFDEGGNKVGHQDYGLEGLLEKGLTVKGEKAGLFTPGRLPTPGETVVIVEGVKDAAALNAMGFFAMGTPGTTFRSEWARAFRDCRVVLIPDRDEASYTHFGRVGKLLAGVAVSVSRVDLPFEMAEGGGKDVRDVLQQPSGEATLRKLIEETVAAASTKEQDASGPESPITNGAEIESEDGTVLVPIPLADVLEKIADATGGWPRRVDNVLFVDDGGICWLDRPAALFGWLSRRTGVIRWHRSRGCASKEETFAELQRTARRYEAIEQFPHEPPVQSHYYACNTPEPGDGKRLAELLDFFCPESDVDRQLIQAAFATPLWGGAAGSRPAILFTAVKGRGRGKSKLAQYLAYVFGGYVDISPNEDAGAIKTRLLTAEAMPLRVALLDNVKTTRFSWAELESLITSPVISGRRLYVGNGSRPNNVTWAITLNGASLSTDMAQRTVEIKLGDPAYDGTWEERLRAYIDDHRLEIIGDLVAFLRSHKKPLSQATRWAAWETEVLSHVADPNACLSAILARRSQVDVEEEEGEIVEDYFASKLRALDYVPDREDIFLPNEIAARWFNAATGDNRKVAGVTRTLKQLRDEERVTRIIPSRAGQLGGERGFRWVGQYADASDPTKFDIRHRMAEKRESREDGQVRMGEF